MVRVDWSRRRRSSSTARRTGNLLTFRKRKRLRRTESSFHSPPRRPHATPTATKASSSPGEGDSSEGEGVEARGLRGWRSTSKQWARSLARSARRQGAWSGVARARGGCSPGRGGWSRLADVEARAVSEGALQLEDGAGGLAHGRVEHHHLQAEVEVGACHGVVVSNGGEGAGSGSGLQVQALQAPVQVGCAGMLAGGGGRWWRGAWWRRRGGAARHVKGEDAGDDHVRRVRLGEVRRDLLDDQQRRCERRLESRRHAAPRADGRVVALIHLSRHGARTREWQTILHAMLCLS